MSCQIFISKVGNSARALIKVNTGTSTPQDTKVTGKASLGAEEEISALDASLGHPDMEGRHPETQFGKVVEVCVASKDREAAGSAAVCHITQSALP